MIQSINCIMVELLAYGQTLGCCSKMGSALVLGNDVHILGGVGWLQF